jgi:hypothetical protein
VRRADVLRGGGERRERTAQPAGDASLSQQHVGGERFCQAVFAARTTVSNGIAVANKRRRAAEGA